MKTFSSFSTFCVVLFLLSSAAATAQLHGHIVQTTANPKVSIGTVNTNLQPHERLAVRGGSISIDGNTNGFLVGDNASSSIHDWGTRWYGLFKGDASVFSLAMNQANTYASPVLLNSFYGLGFRTKHGAMTLMENGVVYIGRTSGQTMDLTKITQLADNTDTYPTYRVHIDGGLRARRVRVDLDVWQDQVFYEDYPLLSLYEVEDFIDKNFHLPNVPSEEEICNTGADLGEVSGILLQKIEELTLYTIQQQKELDALREELKEVKQR